jgi:hypothetical protein
MRAMERLHEITDGGPCTIVEVGAARNLRPHALIDDGWATRVFAWYAAETGGRLTTIDPNRRALSCARQLTAPWSAAVDYVQDAAERRLAAFGAIDLLYMDGPSDATMHRRAWDALRCRPRLVLWDDIVTPGHPVPGAPPQKVYKQWPPPGNLPEWAVKGALAIPAMLEDGYTVVFAVDRQVLLGAA